MQKCASLKTKCVETDVPAAPAAVFGLRPASKNYLIVVDTSATSTKQCEAITNVAIRIMRLKRDG